MRKTARALAASIALVLAVPVSLYRPPIAQAATWETTERISVAPSQTTTDGNSGEPSISWDGRYVVFSSLASNIVPGDSNGLRDIFLIDRQTGTRSRIGLPPAGEPNGGARQPVISGDGRFVAFTSAASNLVSGDNNFLEDVFVQDLQTGSIERVSVNTAGDEANSASGDPAISFDGRYVAFVSLASNLSPGDTNGTWDIFIRDRATGRTKRVSKTPAGMPLNGASEKPSISYDARYIAFQTAATNLDPADTTPFRDIYIADLVSDTIERISVPLDPTEATEGDSTNPSVTSDGTRVAFVSLASNLVAGDLPSAPEVFVRDRSTGTTTRVSVASDGSPVEGNAGRPPYAQGTRVAFFTSAQAAPTDDNFSTDVYLRDLSAGTTVQVSIYAGQNLNDDAANPVISGDGRFVAYETPGAFPSGWPDSDGNLDVYLAYSGEPSVSPPAPPGPLPDFEVGPPPSAPSDLTATAVGDNFAALSWADNSSDEFLFKVERKVASGSYSEVARLGADTTSWTDTGLLGGTTYVYRVRAANSEGNSSYSNELTVTTTGGFPPAAPSGLQATPLDPYSVRLDWIDNAVNEDSYRVERRELASGFSEIAVLGANSQSYLDSGLSPFTTYVYRVRASNSAGDSAYSNEVTVTTPSPAAPEAPTGLTVYSVGATRVVLRWNDNSSREDGFKVERSREGGPYVSIASLPPNTVRFEDKGLDDSTSYSYRVVAFNLGGSSAPSNVASVTTKPATICRIDALVYTVDSGSGQEDIFVRSTDGRFSKRVTSTVASEQEVSVSPSGNEIWFSSTERGRRKLFSVDVDGTSRRIRSNQPSGNFDDWGPALWAAPDGSRKLVVFVSNRGGSEEIYSMKPDGSGLARLTNIGSGSRRGPVISPDGSYVYFASNHSGTFRIYKVSAAGGTPAELAASVPGNQFDPAISPDGKRLAYITDRFGGGARLVERDLLSGAERTLMAASVPYAERPRWSPDGKFLYVTVLDPSGNFDIKKIEGASGSMTGELTTSAAERVGDAAPVAPYEASPSPTFFAEGATTGGFATWLLLANPSTDSRSPANPARACITLLTEEGKKSLGVVDIPAGYRISIDVGSYWRSFSVGAVVEAIRGSVAAERAVYSSAPSKVGAHLSKGSKTLSRAWYTAEGATAGEFETWILVSNPGTIAANVDISLVTSSGPTSPYRVSVPAGARVSVRADDLLPDSFDVAASVTSDRPVVVERATYTSGPSRRGATASPAFPSGRTTWYVGEGATSGGFETWLLIANPNDQPACAEVTLLVGGPGGGPLTIYGGSRPPLCMGPKQRRTLNLGYYVSSYDVASKVVSVAGSDGTYSATQPRGIVVERAVYHDHPSLGKGAASGEGSPRADFAWLGVEGATAGGFETWTLIANPGSQPACASITYLTDVGPIPDPRANPVCLRPGARVSIRADDVVWSYHVSALVRAVPGSAGGISAPVAQPIVVEHSVYAPPELAGDSTSGPARIVASP